ncbi:MAG: hypothetical protein UV58_C0007G0033 [Candidatus Wolfebacteria bacterium GW2011_GWC1_43_10]|uniref:Uncharacterized protein n=2 Tax=Candidatus Wolfeibacteriota TaxID=1752735 RepID=A0A0G1CAX1_9BACT|nr:MAG: hypothetical protein UV58_C0007G0033 [Candidatus Wolfebacteria bacterium GW2011_GWC1_43_10]KKT22516.1 MAG: hypothetical protein UW08_C0007G0012 [Parcubacteria group bacterium GW2011_GWB1_43_8b]OGM89526.1 MAG: hypothetical protein A2108_03160 [Candidatus Wolfebacteria bacterium GWA1_42_9]
MAIVIEEEKEKGGRWFGFGVIFIILAILGVAVYYLFFVKPDLIGAVVPIKFRSIDELARLQFDPQEVVSSEFFRSSRQFVPPPTIIPAGNASPFGVF